MGNKQSKNAPSDHNKETKKKKRSKKKASDQSAERKRRLSARTSTSFSHSKSSRKKREYTYAEILQLIEDELCNYVPIDLSGLILSFIPRSTIGDESVNSIHI